MNPELEAKLDAEIAQVRKALVAARLKLLSILNAIAIAVGGGILALHQMYPSAVADFTATMTPGQKLVALAAWSGLVQLFIHRTKKAV